MFSGGPLHGPGAVLSRNLSGEPVSWIAVRYVSKCVSWAWKLDIRFPSPAHLPLSWVSSTASPHIKCILCATWEVPTDSLFCVFATQIIHATSQGRVLAISAHPFLSLGNFTCFFCPVLCPPLCPCSRWSPGSSLRLNRKFSLLASSSSPKHRSH